MGRMVKHGSWFPKLKLNAYETFSAMHRDYNWLCATRTWAGVGPVWFMPQRKKESRVTPKTNGLLLSSVATGCLIASMAGAASHREAPGITQQPKIDNTDFYVFRSYEPGREDYVTMIANFQPIQAPYGGPNYFTMDSDAVYEIHVDNDGDAIEDLTFQFRFDNDLKDDTGIQLDIAGETVAIPLRQAGPITRAEPTAALNETETYTVQLIRGDRRSGTASALSHGGGTTFTKPVDYIGMKTLPDYDAYADLYMYDDVAIDGCDAPGRVFAGQRAEAFAINLGEVFDLINLVPIQGDSSDNDEDDAYPEYDVANPFPGGITQDRDNDDLIDEANITSLAIEVPIACLTSDGEPVIGAWSTTSLPQAEIEDPSPTYEQTSRYGGAFVQQSRLGAPLVNEVVIGLPDKDLFNAAEPMQDGALAVYVTNPTLPALIDALFRDAVGADGNIAPTNFPRTDLVATFLTGYAGFNAFSGDDNAAAEMLRLNTAVPPTPIGEQHPFGVIAEDLAGFPNGRRPGDDVTDVALRVVMGRLCHPVPLGAELGVEGATEDTDSDLINLGFCTPDQAPVGDQPFTDGAPILATELQNVFPYLNTPIPGSPEGADGDDGN